MNKNECPKIKIKDEKNCNKIEMKQNTTKKAKVMSCMKIFFFPLEVEKRNTKCTSCFSQPQNLRTFKTFKILRLWKLQIMYKPTQKRTKANHIYNYIDHWHTNKRHKLLLFRTWRKNEKLLKDRSSRWNELWYEPQLKNMETIGNPIVSNGWWTTGFNITKIPIMWVPFHIIPLLF